MWLAAYEVSCCMNLTVHLWGEFLLYAVFIIFSWAYETPQGLSAFWLVGTAGNLNVQFGIILLILCFWWYSHPPLCLKMIQIPMFYLLQRLRLQLTLEQHDFFFFNVYFIYLAVLGLSCNMWDLVPWPGIKPGPPALGARSLSHWTARDIPNNMILNCASPLTVDLFQ